MNKLLDENICNEFFGIYLIYLDSKDANLNCLDEAKNFGKHSIRSYLSTYVITAKKRFDYADPDLAMEKSVLINLVESELFRHPLFNTYWVTNGLYKWEFGLRSQFTRSIVWQASLCFYLTIGEALLLTILILVLLFSL